jgi:hypothetical protein
MVTGRRESHTAPPLAGKKRMPERRGKARGHLIFAIELLISY